MGTSSGIGSAKWSGGCLCGAVRFSVSGRPREVIACHCSQCRRTSGSFAISAEFAGEDLHIAGEVSVTWHRSSSFAQRAFCPVCGSRLFWREDGDPMIWIALGALDDPGGLAIEKHIFVASKPACYAITDGKPQFAGYADTASDAMKARE